MTINNDYYNCNYCLYYLYFIGVTNMKTMYVDACTIFHRLSRCRVCTRIVNYVLLLWFFFPTAFYTHNVDLSKNSSSVVFIKFKINNIIIRYWLLLLLPIINLLYLFLFILCIWYCDIHNIYKNKCEFRQIKNFLAIINFVLTVNRENMIKLYKYRYV